MTGVSPNSATGSTVASALKSASNTESSTHSDMPPQDHGHQGSFLALMIGSIGVVFGDIGTSPLYAMRTALEHTRHGANQHLAIFGVISLVFWTLLLLVTVKYVIFLMRADNRGEGGTLALMALAQKALGHYSSTMFFLAMCGAALFYGDSIITPALSVLGAIEGIKEAPGIGHSLDSVIVPAAFIILVVLFIVQSKGTAKVARFFGPIMMLWFVVIGVMGALFVVQKPEIIMALSPHFGILFLFDNGLTGFVILGSVFLVVTGAEALYADMGHFGKKPINMAWLLIAFPSLTLCYLGQGALILMHPAAIADPFWHMVPKFAYWPILVLATMASIIASQAVISGAYSMSQQAVQLGLLPRLDITRTSETQAGQIFVPQINNMLMVGVLVLVVIFRSSDSLTSAYGIAVTGTMLISTIMAYIVMRRVWHWSKLQVLALLIPLGSIESFFMASNLLKIPDGGWMPLALGGALILIMLTWSKGTKIVIEKTRRESVALVDLIEMLKLRPPHRAQGTAIFLTSDSEVAPVALMHNLKHNKVLHEKNIILSVKTANTPRISEDDRISIEVYNEDFKKVTISYGFMESPNLPKALGLCRKQGLKFDIMATSFFLGRRSVVAAAQSGMPLWQDKLFIFLMKNATNPTEFFHIPPGRVVEMGTQVSI